METSFRVFDANPHTEIRKHCRFNVATLSPAIICLLYDFPHTTTYSFNTDANGYLKGKPAGKNETEAKRKIGYSGLIKLIHSIYAHVIYIRLDA